MVNTQQSNTDAADASLAWDENRSIQRMGGQKPLIEKLVVLFIRDTPKQIEEAFIGIEKQNYDCSHMAIHSLKGTSSIFCTQRLESICDELLVALKERNWQQSAIIHHELSDEYFKLEVEFKAFLKH